MISAPAGDSMYHTLPSPWPLISPAALSPANRYSGWPLYATCFTPPSRLMVVSLLASIPEPAWGAVLVVTGGHWAAQVPVHADFVELSGVYR